ncbi:DUF4191 domain-containing protein [Gryllotalpicola protaetiae]|uniref:DUF4191 domain-containing protein n=1 Tax=Gryllotalpicola protaetiae TaxID=2419771 RepID=A0A387BV98_9MICO|nr:DUF4191 domain-containing protein [Gryllotalpicola protaetiae]AYG05026.1 DUF4191 domain-containing protein [Gryllotalpicola protaetiae]
MARTSSSAATPAAEPGRIRQMWDVFQMTRKYDKQALPLMIGGFLLPVVIGVVLALLLSPGVLSRILWIVAGVLGGVLLATVILGRRAEGAAYSQINGQPGAVGAVLRSSLKRGWRGSEMPVAVNSKTRDAIYRAVGRGGVVLISEGPKSRTGRMLDEERRKIARTVPNVAVTTLSVGPDVDSVPLRKVASALAKIKPSLTKSEVQAVDNRLSSLQAPMPIPKGVDPNRVRAPRQPR